MSLVNNFRLAASTALTHIADDPIVLALQVSRRIPSSFVGPAARMVTRLFPHSVAPFALIATHLTGDQAGLDAKFARTIGHGLSGNRARIAADVALAAGRPQIADQLLTLAVGARGLSATVARRKWYDGDMTGAIVALENEDGAAGRQRSRLVGERQTFSGWTPELSAVAMKPVPGRVLHLLTNSLPHTGSGYAQRSHSILLAQQEAGHEVMAVTRLGYPVQVGKVLAASEDVVDGVRYRRLLPPRLAKTADARLQQEAEELLQVALEFRPSVLHTTTHFTNGLVVGAVASALGIPWLYEVRGQLADTWAASRQEEAKTSERYISFREVEMRVMQCADGVATLGAAMLKGIVAQGIPEEKVLITPNAVGGDFLDEPSVPEAARRRLGLDPSLNYIGTVSSLVRYEGLDDLMDAFALLEPEFPSLRLLIVGGGTAAPELEEQASLLGVKHKVIFTGRVPRDETSLYHQALDVFVVPRKDLDVTQAVTPLKPVEALASARPVVASDLPALREIVHDGVNGIITPAGDPQELAHALAKLLKDAHLRSEFGRQGRRDILNSRTWASNAQRYSSCYQEISKFKNRKGVRP